VTPGREGRRLDAREQLRAAYDILDAIGMDAFAERARRKLAATGAKRRRRIDETRDQLTPQEEQIDRLAREGLSNPEVGARLFLSPRTVEWHLRSVFAKLGITTRMGLHTALPTRERDAMPAEMALAHYDREIRVLLDGKLPGHPHGVDVDQDEQECKLKTPTRPPDGAEMGAASSIRTTPNLLRGRMGHRMLCPQKLAGGCLRSPSGPLARE
jgi:DNA-binding CsgD family transcriptional regulator